MELSRGYLKRTIAFYRGYLAGHLGFDSRHCTWLPEELTDRGELRQDLQRNQQPD